MLENNSKLIEKEFDKNSQCSKRIQNVFKRVRKVFEANTQRVRRGVENNSEITREEFENNSS